MGLGQGGRLSPEAVAFEPGADGGPGLAESTFHHFADYNLDPDLGAPSFVSEPPGDGFRREPAALAETHRYFRNLALWLAGRPVWDPALKQRKAR